MQEPASPQTPARRAFIPERSVSPEQLHPILAKLIHLRTKSKKAKGEVLQAYDIDTDDVLFGKGDGCDVRIYTANVSNEHCRITFDEDSHQATMRVLSNFGIVINEDSLPANATHTMSTGDMIDIDGRRFRFEYSAATSADSTARSTVPQAVIPPSPALRGFALRPSRSASNLRVPPAENLQAPLQQSSPAKPAPASRRISSTRSQRIHVFPAYTKTDEVRLAIASLAERAPPNSPIRIRARFDAESMASPGALGLTSGPVDKWRQMHGKGPARSKSANVERGGDDLVYMESLAEESPKDKDEMEAKESSKLFARSEIVNAGPFMTPQQPKRTTRVPRTSVAPRVKKDAHSHTVEDVTPMDAIGEPLTPRSIPLPPSAETPYLPASIEDTPVQTPSKEDFPFPASSPSTPTPTSRIASSGLELDRALREPDLETEHAVPTTPTSVPLPPSAFTPYVLTWGPSTEMEEEINADNPDEEDEDGDDFFDAEVPAPAETPIPSRPQTPVRQNSNGPISLRRHLLLNSVQKISYEMQLQRLIAQRAQQEEERTRAADREQETQREEDEEQDSGPNTAREDQCLVLNTAITLASVAPERSGLDEVDTMAEAVPPPLEQGGHIDTAPTASLTPADEAGQANQGQTAPASGHIVGAVKSRDLTESTRRNILAEIETLRAQGEVSDDDLMVDNSLDLTADDDDDEDELGEDDDPSRAGHLDSEAQSDTQKYSSSPRNIEPSQMPLPASPSRVSSTGATELKETLTRLWQSQRRSFFGGWFSPQVKPQAAQRQGRKSMSDVFGSPTRYGPALSSVELHPTASIFAHKTPCSNESDVGLAKSLEDMQWQEQDEPQPGLTEDLGTPASQVEGILLAEIQDLQRETSDETGSARTPILDAPGIPSFIPADTAPSSPSRFGGIRARIQSLRRASTSGSEARRIPAQQSIHDAAVGEPTPHFHYAVDNDHPEDKGRRSSAASRRVGHVEYAPMDEREAIPRDRSLVERLERQKEVVSANGLSEPGDRSGVIGQLIADLGGKLDELTKGSSAGSLDLPCQQAIEHAPMKDTQSPAPHPSTPLFTGVRQLFRTVPSMATPDLHGRKELFVHDSLRSPLQEGNRLEARASEPPTRATSPAVAHAAPALRARRLAASSVNSGPTTITDPARKTRAAKAAKSDAAPQATKKRPSRAKAAATPRVELQDEPRAEEDELQDIILVAPVTGRPGRRIAISSDTVTIARESSSKGKSTSAPAKRTAARSASLKPDQELTEKPATRPRRQAAATENPATVPVVQGTSRPKRVTAARSKSDNAQPAEETVAKSGKRSVVKSAPALAVPEDAPAPIKRVTRAARKAVD